ncbi:hypothetical protein NQ318_009823 [Aromia moschata]|uniref:Uncharacterized protein n=1 Tax=Aromia moschata TaxID=1265417 RepID=A0AAV8XMY9_9CUCU|nr:hypothetical protein NQ318_009823 [Aromia moschata]
MGMYKNVDSVELNNVTDIRTPHDEVPLNIAFLQTKRHSLGNFVSNKNDVYNYGLLMENSRKNIRQSNVKLLPTLDLTLGQLKQALSKFLHGKDNVKKRHLRSVPVYFMEAAY